MPMKLFFVVLIHHLPKSHNLKLIYKPLMHVVAQQTISISLRVLIWFHAILNWKKCFFRGKAESETKYAKMKNVCLFYCNNGLADVNYLWLIFRTMEEGKTFVLIEKIVPLCADIHG